MWWCETSTTSECDWGVEKAHDETGGSQQNHRRWQYGKPENDSHHCCMCAGSMQFRPPSCARWMACWESTRRRTSANWVTSPYVLTSVLQISKQGQVARVLYAPARDGFYRVEECFCSQYVLSFFFSFALSLDLSRFSSLSLSYSLALPFACSRAFEFFHPSILALTLVIRTPPLGVVLCWMSVYECVCVRVCWCVSVCVCVWLHANIRIQYGTTICGSIFYSSYDHYVRTTCHQETTHDTKSTSVAVQLLSSGRERRPRVRYQKKTIHVSYW